MSLPVMGLVGPGSSSIGTSIEKTPSLTSPVQTSVGGTGSRGKSTPPTLSESGVNSIATVVSSAAMVPTNWNGVSGVITAPSANR